MSASLARHCKSCKQYQTILLPLLGKNILSCPNCKEIWGEIKNSQDIFDHCPVCDCRQFYLAKDFNHFAGCLIMGVGIILVPWTYGLSLPVFALIDWLLHKRVPWITVCYRCGTEFRGFDTVQRFKPFLHHIGLKYDKYR